MARCYVTRDPKDGSPPGFVGGSLASQVKIQELSDRRPFGRTETRPSGSTRSCATRHRWSAALVATRPSQSYAYLDAFLTMVRYVAESRDGGSTRVVRNGDSAARHNRNCARTAKAM